MSEPCPRCAAVTERETTAVIGIDRCVACRALCVREGGALRVADAAETRRVSVVTQLVSERDLGAMSASSRLAMLRALYVEAGLAETAPGFAAEVAAARLALHRSVSEKAAAVPGTWTVVRSEEPTEGAYRDAPGPRVRSCYRMPRQPLSTTIALVLFSCCLGGIFGWALLTSPSTPVRTFGGLVCAFVVLVLWPAIAIDAHASSEMEAGAGGFALRTKGLLGAREQMLPRAEIWYVEPAVIGQGDARREVVRVFPRSGKPIEVQVPGREAAFAFTAELESALGLAVPLASVVAS